MPKYAKPVDEADIAERKEELSAWQKESAMELNAMGKCFDLLSPLSKASQDRAIKWLADRLETRPYYGEPPF